jgi:hypothetical protein
MDKRIIGYRQVQFYVHVTVKFQLSLEMTDGMMEIASLSRTDEEDGIDTRIQYKADYCAVERVTVGNRWG